MRMQEGDEQAQQQDEMELSVLTQVIKAVMKDRSNNFLHGLSITCPTAYLGY